MNNLNSFFTRCLCLLVFSFMCTACAEKIDMDNGVDSFDDSDDFVTAFLNTTFDKTFDTEHLNPPLQNEGIDVWNNTTKFIPNDATKSTVDIHDLRLFQYSSTGDLVHTYTIGNLTALSNIPITLKKGVNQQIVFVANAPLFDWTDVALFDNIYKMKQLRYDYAAINNDSEVPFVGTITIDQITDNVRIPEVCLRRIAAKVILKYTDAEARYKVKHVSLMNIPASMFFFNEVTSNVYPAGTGTSHTIHPKIVYADDNTQELIWYMPMNRRGNNGSATSLKTKTDKTAPSGQADYVSYLSIYCENKNQDAINKEGICSIYLGSNDPKDYNINPNKTYNVNIKFSGNEIPTDDPRVDINVGDFSFDIDVIDDEVFQSHKIAELSMDINGIEKHPNISLEKVHGNKYRITGSLKLEHRHNILTHLSFRDANNNVLTGYRNNKVFALEGDVFRKLSPSKMSVYFSGLFCGLGNGYEESPYEVCSPNTLSNIRDLTALNDQYNRYVKQVKDVDLQNTPWTPIPSFYLIFDGNDHQIQNLSVQTTQNDAGLFATIARYSAVVKNVTVRSGSVNGNNYVGGIVGRVLEGASIVDCKNYATINGSLNVGGICGEFYRGKQITGCQNHGRVYATRSVGGVVGILRGYKLEQCSNYGEIIGLDNGIGGIAGVAEYNHDILYCYNRGTIMGNSQVGGIEGYSQADKIIGSYNCGDIKAFTSDAGGLIGESVAGGPEFHICYNHASIDARGVSGGIVGRVHGTLKLFDVYHIGEIILEEDDTAGGICGEAAFVESRSGLYTACYTRTKPTFKGHFGHIIGRCSNHNLSRAFYVNEYDKYAPVGDSYSSDRSCTGIKDRQLRGLEPIVADNQAGYILQWLNAVRSVWSQQSNSFPYLNDL